MKIAIIGAGPAGLDALRICLASGHSCEVFEKSGKIGGTWNYTKRTGKDEFGLPIHSSMYEGLRYSQSTLKIFWGIHEVYGMPSPLLWTILEFLRKRNVQPLYLISTAFRTNLPKELMEFGDFPYKEPDHSFIAHEDVLKYISDYAKTFNLLPFIKFHHNVEQVVPIPEEKWSIQIRNLRSQEIVDKEFDAVVVCVGTFSVPSIPKLKGLDTFQGSVIHSHIYRNTDPFIHKKVLIIGSGPSGVDIGKRIATVADKAILSHRSKQESVLKKLSQNLEVKPEIEEFRNNSVIFKDGSEEELDAVILCTGYLYTYPFLSPECGIEVEGNWVKYLYKHIINIDHPTMAFLGIPFRIFPFPIFGLQVKFFLSLLEGKVIKTRDEMMKDVLKNVERVRKPTNRYAHELTLDHVIEYLDDLAETAGIKKIRPVLNKLFKHIQTERVGQIDSSYKLVDDENFVEIY